MSENHYQTLGIPKEATTDQVHRAYRMLAMRYHPDRNSLPEAAVLMAGINQAYEVLSKPSKREVYDREHGRRDEVFDEAVLSAARDTLVKQAWSLMAERPGELVLKNGSRRAAIAFVPEVDTTLVHRFHRSAQGFSVVLGLRFVPPLRLPSEAVAVIDLMHSRLYAGDFPDTTYRDLFKAFL